MDQAEKDTSQKDQEQNKVQDKQETKKTNKKNKSINKGPLNIMSDPKVQREIEELFDDLKGSKEDDYVDSSTVLFLLNMFEVSKTDPEYFWFIYLQVKDKAQLSKNEFVELFMNPPEYYPKDIEDIKNLFNVFDVKGKGKFSKNDFIEFFKYSPIYRSNEALVESNLEKCFENLEKIFGTREITPVEFYQILNHLK